jgi:signal transduction histidine kinase
MTPRHRFAVRLRTSFFLKILFVFVLGFTAVGLYLGASFWYFDWQQGRQTARRTALSYGDLVLAQLSDPPDTTFARELATRLGVRMRIRGPGLDWATDPGFPSFEETDLPVIEDGRLGRAGLSRALGFGADLTRGGYRYLFGLQAGGTGFGTESFTEEMADALFMILLLACVYLATRWLLRPVRVLSEGVERLRSGDLNVEMPTRRTDELGRLMVSFNEMARAVRERLRARDQLLADVSHEIRSPLTRMRVALEMMPDGAAKASVIEDIEETEAMISVLLETERLDSPHGGLARAPTDVGALVKECVAARRGQEPGVEMEAGAAPVVADLDAERMKLVVGNLLANAIRHSSPAGPPVRVEVRKNGTGVRVEVHDRGVGIPEEDLPHVFEPFYRVDRSRSKDTGGYGIGLSLVKRIVEAHGGAIQMTSRVGEGTSVSITLPPTENGERRNGPRW